MSYKQGFVRHTPRYRPPYIGAAEDVNVISADKIYRVDVRGFLDNPDDWDEYYAVHRASDMKIP